MFSFAQSIGYMVINFTSLYVYNLSEKSVGQVPAFSTVVWVYAGFTFVSALGCIFIFRKVEDVNTEGDENEKFTFSQLALDYEGAGALDDDHMRVLYVFNNGDHVLFCTVF